MYQSSSSQTFLRRALAANAAFSELSALLCLLFPAAIGRWLGIPSAEVSSVGIGLFVFAAVLLVLFTRRDLTTGLNRYLVLTVIALDVLWVCGSIALLLTPGTALTVAGQWVVALVALAVADLAIFQIWGLQRSRHRQPILAAEPG